MNIVQKRTACNRDCPDACGIVASIDDGKIVRLQGDPDHPITQGYLCHRTSRFLERQYSPDRLTQPLLRQGNEFVPVSWQDALDRIAGKMLQIKQESGPTSLLYYRSGGSLGMMKHVTDYFFEQYGPVTVKSGDVCTGAGDAAQMEDFGDEDSHDAFDLLHSKTIVLWGKNAFVSHVHLIPILKEARRRGARVVLIDPVHHQTTQVSDFYFQPRPGGDIAFALGAARVLLVNHWHDTGAGSYCDHFDEFRALVMSRDVSTWAELAGITEAELEQFASLYAEGPSSIMVGWGMQRRARGAATVRAVDALAAISGNLGIAGGGISFFFKRRGAFDLSFSAGLENAVRAIPEPLLGRGILETDDPPIRMAWIANGNPVAMLPESETVAEALRSREMTVVVDSFMTDTTDCADIVLPTTTLLEEDDLLGAYGHHWLIESRPVVEPPTGVHSDYEIAQQLAERVGLNGEFKQSAEDWKRRILRNVADQGASLEDLRRGPVRSPVAKQVLYEDRKFPTPSGRVNLIRDVDPTAPTTTSERPLLLMAISTADAQGSQWVEDAQDGPAIATLHPDAANGLTDGSIAVVESEVGSLKVRLRFDDQQRRDILLMPKGGWLREGRCANALIRGELSDAGGCAAYYDTPVRILPAS